MRKISSSANQRRTEVVSDRADSRSWPNGFSTITRVQPPSRSRRSPISRSTVSNACGGTAR